jgi:Flp pilus assembly protein TadD
VLAHYVRGQAALVQSRWETAASAFARVIELYPGSAAGYHGLGVASEELGRIDDAERAYDKALALAPDDEALRARLAFMLERAPREARALALFRELADRGTTIPEVWIALGRAAYDTGDLAAAEAAFTRAAALRDDGPTWFNLGVVRLRLDRRPDARQAFERAAAHADTRDRATAELERLRAP